VLADPEQKQAFASLFRALLRFESRAKLLPRTEAEILPIVLGPEKVVVPGEPPLTEEALDAYADMTCFLYEQKTPGKTIDSQENRAIFASVICNKYNQAPTAADRRAVANFALTWAKFKVAWLAAPPEHQAELIKSWETKIKLPDRESDKLIKLVLLTGPWATAAKLSAASHTDEKYTPKSESEPPPGETAEESSATPVPQGQATTAKMGSLSPEEPQDK
jgi:hypothetical protein